ncbi:MAG TPA: zf-HC2 domain-containing protein [Acetivibrio clariflavus]|nr:zf-HC2 domain-containing protein [Acetivibrio clariflavus]
MKAVNKQTCEKVKSLLPLYLSDELEESEKKEVEEHIYECEKCKELFYIKEDKFL